MNYWLDLFTGTTWKEFRDAGAMISGFRLKQKKTSDRVKPGDVLLCYLTGVMRWVGALEVIGQSDDTHRIWKDADFPVRLEVKAIILLDPETGIPMDRLEGRVSFFAGPSDRGKFRGVVRGSLRLLESKDGDMILGLVKDAESSPVSRPVDPHKLARKPLFKAQRTVGKNTIEALVSVPEAEETTTEAGASDIPSAELADVPSHTAIQGLLLKLGAEMGLDVWVARNDRSRAFEGESLGRLPRVVDKLPTQFNEATQRTIELIDVLWLKGNSIAAAFEVECTTSIYSGLLRMSDLLSLQPNLDIKLYLVTPDERRDKVEQEIRRPTFQLRPRPLVCGFLPFSKLRQQIDGILELGLARSLSSEFLEHTAEYFAVSEDANTDH